MKRVLYIIVLVLVIGCKTEKKQKPTVINSDELKSTVSFLASNQLEGRSIGSAGIERAAIYIENIFKEYNVKPYFETFRDSFNIKDAVGYNIVGYIEGNDSKLKNEFIILGAHYDHLGIINEVNGDSIANGANDNASGTSAVLALTKYFANEKTNKRSVMFILFSGEEGGLLGSEHLAKKLKSMNIDLYTMVNFEMIGVPLIDASYEAFISGYELSNMSAKINEYANSNLTGFSEISKQHNLFTMSDNYPFYKTFKVPCQTIASCDLTNFDYYHHVDDEVDKLDYNFMERLVNKVIPAIEKMSNTSTKEIKMIHE